MAHISDLISTDIDQYLKSHEHKSLLQASSLAGSVR